MFKLYSDIELMQRQHIREVFHEVDGNAFVQLSTGQGLLANLPKNWPSSIYSIPLRTSSTECGSIIEFGPAHDPELMGGRFHDQSGMLLWCSLPDGKPFADLAKQFGYPSSYCRDADIGSFIDFGCAIDNIDVIFLAMKMVKTLLSAFKITAQDTAFIEQRSMRKNKEILPGTPSPGPKTL